jgi:hypothetical protein
LFVVVDVAVVGRFFESNLEVFMVWWIMFF